MLELIKLIAVCAAIIAVCQVVQTAHYLDTPAQAGGAMPVIIDGISSRAANGPHSLPVELRKPIRILP